MITTIITVTTMVTVFAFAFIAIIIVVTTNTMTIATTNFLLLPLLCLSSLQVGYCYRTPGWAAAAAWD